MAIQLTTTVRELILATLQNRLTGVHVTEMDVIGETSWDDYGKGEVVWVVSGRLRSGKLYKIPLNLSDDKVLWLTTGELLSEIDKVAQAFRVAASLEGAAPQTRRGFSKALDEQYPGWDGR